MIRVLSLPDWREGNTYQGLLGRALAAEGCEVVYPPGYRRLLPLARTGVAGVDLLHLHWPEYYFLPRRDPFDALRYRRFRFDLWLATRRRPLVYTAHNLLPHNRDERLDRVVQKNYRALLRRAAAIITHSAAAARTLAEFCPRLAPVHVVPHGDPAETFPPLPDRATARRQLGLDPAEPLVLVFGRAEPYKGIEELLAAWPQAHPTARLLVAGTPHHGAFPQVLAKLAAGHPRITLDLRWLAPEELATRLAAADVALFNYRSIFTSGAGCLARSLGKKILLPHRLATVDLMEPSPTVFRFESLEADFPGALARALAAPEDPAGTAAWRNATAWTAVARQTAAIYRQVLA